MPNASKSSPAEAVQTAMRIRSRIARETVRNARYEREVTASIGIDTFDGRQDATPADLRRRANLALQNAKRRGKNQVWLFADEEEEGRALVRRSHPRHVRISRRPRPHLGVGVAQQHARVLPQYGQVVRDHALVVDLAQAQLAVRDVLLKNNALFAH